MAGVEGIIEQYVTEDRLDSKLKFWMREITDYQWRPIEQPTPAHAALLVVDMTKPFVHEGEPLSSPNAKVILPRIRNMVNAFRLAQRPVTYTTGFDAFYRGFRVYFPADGTASLNETLHINALRNIATWAGYVVASADIVRWLNDGPS